MWGEDATFKFQLEEAKLNLTSRVFRFEGLCSNGSALNFI
jgi:hypothetical protein